MSAKKILVKCEAPFKVAHDELHELQGDLKSLPRAEYEKLRRAILEDGFSFAIHAWQHKKKWFILDGHQRLKVVKKLIEEEGYAPMSLPVVPVKADSYDQAKRKLLTAASNYGQGNPEGLAAFLKDANISADELSGLVSISGIDTVAFIEKHLAQVAAAATDAGDVSNFGGDASSIPLGDASLNPAAGDVKMIQLFFPTAHYAEFLEKAGKLQEVLKVEHLSGAVLEVVRESYQAHCENKPKLERKVRRRK